jgi:hypothetical protein
VLYCLRRTFYQTIGSRVQARITSTTRLSTGRHRRAFVLDPPGTGRGARAGDVLACGLTTVIGALSASLRAHVVKQIDSRSEPVGADAVEVCRSLAGAEAAVSERTAFERDIEQAKSALAGLVAGTGALPSLAAVGAAFGIRQWLGECPRVAIRDDDPAPAAEVRSRAT